MEEVRIMILDDDKDFKYRFIHYVVNACKNVSIYTLEEAEVLAMDNISLKNNLKKCTVLVADEILNKRLSHFYEKEQFIYICLTQNNCTHITEMESKIQYIYKYQDASVILARIINICSIQNIEIKRNQSSEKLSIITVTGASGGVGKTALCLTFARLRRQLGRRNPLIIDMRSMSDHYVYFPQTEISEQEDLNFLLLDEERGTSNPEKYILRDKYGVAEFIMPQEHRSDITELNREEMRKFLERIQEWCIFDLVIFEMGNFLNEDRKSTRLNSSHPVISYAVFCLKKKKKKK